MQQYFEIPSVDQTIRKSILDGIVYRVLAETGMTAEDVIFGESYNTAHQVGSTVGEETAVAYDAPERIYVEVEEERDEYSRINRQVGMNVEIPFFNNAVDQVRVSPQLTGYNVTITLKRVAASKDELQRWVNRFDSLIDMGRYSLVTESEAYYLLPKPLLILLNACYVASETRVDTFTSFKDYLMAYFTDDVTTVANDAGKQDTLSVRFAPTRIELVYNVNQPAWDKDENHYEASFDIHFQHRIPEEVVASYPYIINQTELPPEWWPQIDPPWVSNEERVKRSQTQAGQDSTWWINETRQLIQLPYLLAPLEQYRRLHYNWSDIALPIFGTDVAFGEDNMVSPTVFNIDDLPYVWNEALIPYINHCRRIDPTGMTGVFRFACFEEGLLIEPKLYNWDIDNNFKLNRTMNVRKNYFILETVIRDWRGIDLWPLQLYPKAAEVLIKWLFPEWDTKDEWWDLPKLPPSVIDRIPIDKFKDRDYYLTVFNTGILTMKGADDA